MSENIKSSLEKAGYTKDMPTDTEISDYESIIVSNKEGEIIKFYRRIGKERKLDNTTNFSDSWDIFNSLI